MEERNKMFNEMKERNKMLNDMAKVIFDKLKKDFSLHESLHLFVVLLSNIISASHNENKVEQILDSLCVQIRAGVDYCVKTGFEKVDNI